MKSIIGILLLTVIALTSTCRTQPETTSSTAESSYRNLSSEASYVGIDVCKTCHATQYETFIQAEMGRSFRKATLANSNANFVNPEPVYDSSVNLNYLPYHDGEDLFVMEYQLSGQDTVHKRIEQIDYIVGSGQHTNSHIMEERGYLYQMPLTWYAQDRKWDLPPKFAGGNNSRFSRPIPLQCMTCHNAIPEFIEGSENRYANVPHGIDCERCHGPGSIHVSEIQAGRVVDVANAIDYSIVNPAKLPVDRQFDICQNCHMQGASVFKPGKTALDFRPGGKLTDVQNVFWPRYADSARVFIMASHPDRLKMSSCFRESHEAPEEFQPLTCITCHDPHVGIKSLGVDSYNEKCQSCHSPVRKNLCTEVEAVRALSGNNCISCHMPKSGSADIPHVRITDHYIRRQEPGEQLLLTPEEMAAQKEFLGLASLIEEAPSQRDIAEGFLTYYEQITDDPVFLDSALVYLAKAQKDVSPDALARLWIWAWYWKKDHRSITNLARSLDEQSIQDAWTFYRIGEAFRSSGQSSDAVHYLELALDRAPEHLRFMNKLAGAYQEDGQLLRAISTYDALLDADPKFEIAYNDRGFTRLLLGNFEEAEADFVVALDLDPNSVTALANLASLYYNTNRKPEALPYVQRLLNRDPDNADYRRLWNLLR